MPPAFVFVGIIWRDVLFAITWLLAAAIAFAAVERRMAVRVPAQVAGTRAVRLRRLAAPECADRGADPRRLHRLAVAHVAESERR